MYCTPPPYGASRFNQPVQDAPQAIHGLTAQEDKLSEILVLGDEHATLFPGERQQRFVRHVGEAVPGGQDIVPEVCQEWSRPFYDGSKMGQTCCTPASAQSSPSVAARSPRETVESVVERTNTPRAGAVTVSTSSP